MSLVSGQTMILAVFAVGGVFLGAVTIGGLLMSSQLRQAADFRASTNAIAAADAGVEWALHCYTRSERFRCPKPASEEGTPLTFFSNELPGATTAAQVTCYIIDPSSGSEVFDSCNNVATTRVLSRGTFGGASRVFEVPDVQSFAPR